MNGCNGGLNARPTYGDATTECTLRLSMGCPFTNTTMSSAWGEVNRAPQVSTDNHGTRVAGILQRRHFRVRNLTQELASVVLKRLSVDASPLIAKAFVETSRCMEVHLKYDRAPWTGLQCVGSSGPFAAAFTEVVQQSAWTQHVVAPTRYRAGQQPSLLDLVITNERHFVDQVTINAPLGHSDHCVLTFEFICYWARNPEPQTWIRNFCRADFSGMRIFLNQVKLGPASVEDLYRTIVQKVHEADAMYVPKKPARSRMSCKLPKRIRRLLEKRSQLFFKKLATGDTEDELAFRKMRDRCTSEIRQWNIRKQATILDFARKNITKMVAGLKSMDYETRLVVLDLFPLEYRRLRGDLILTYALFEQGLANRFFTVDPANTRRGHELSEDDLRLMLVADVHLGEQSLNFQMSNYVYGRTKDGVHIIKLNKTWEKILLAARAIAAVDVAADVCAIGCKPFTQRAVLKFAHYTRSSAVAGRFTPGAFTNQKQSCFREPRLLIVSDPRSDHQPVMEASAVNIPVIALCTTDTPINRVDIVIPCNNKSENSIAVIWWLLAREVRRIRGEDLRTQPWSVMVDLFRYRDPNEEQQEAVEEAEDARLEPVLPAGPILTRHRKAFTSEEQNSSKFSIIIKDSNISVDTDASLPYNHCHGCADDAADNW
ncbi:small subunit ribosomal protein SAe, partial [Clonorchis sinensis]